MKNSWPEHTDALVCLVAWLNRQNAIYLLDLCLHQMGMVCMELLWNTLSHEQGGTCWTSAFCMDVHSLQ